MRLPNQPDSNTSHIRLFSLRTFSCRMCLLATCYQKASFSTRINKFKFKRVVSPKVAKRRARKEKVRGEKAIVKLVFLRSFLVDAKLLDQE